MQDTGAPAALPPHSCTEAQGYTLQLVCQSAVPSRPSNGEGNTLQRPSGNRHLTETRLLHRPGQPMVEMTRRCTQRRVDAGGHSHPIEHDSALTQNKVQTPATAWVSPENALSEGSQPPQATRCMSLIPPSVLDRRIHTERRWRSGCREPGAVGRCSADGCGLALFG